MKLLSFEEFRQMQTTPEALDKTCDYIADKLRVFLKRQEPVLICFPNKGEDSLANIFGKAVVRCGGKPIYWGPDFRWKELLRLAFDTHAHTVIAAPTIALGLMKLSKVTGTPL